MSNITAGSVSWLHLRGQSSTNVWTVSCFKKLNLSPRAKGGIRNYHLRFLTSAEDKSWILNSRNKLCNIVNETVGKKRDNMRTAAAWTGQTCAKTLSNKCWNMFGLCWIVIVAVISDFSLTFTLMNGCYHKNTAGGAGFYCQIKDFMQRTKNAAYFSSRLLL